MVCLGILFGCKISSFESYVVTVLVVIGMIVVLRVLCYVIFRLMINRSSTPGESDESDLQNRVGNV